MTKQRIEYLDFAKGFAILSIVLFHYFQPYVSGFFAQAIMIGGTGVHLFFLLSGFSLGLNTEPISPSLFYKMRFLKIAIPYYAVVLISYVVNLFYPVYEGDGIYALGGHLFFYKMFDERIIGSLGYHLWFMSTLLQFYAFFPAVVWIKQSLSIRKFLSASFLISLLYWIVLVGFELSEQRVYNSFFLRYFWEFSLGLVLGGLYSERRYEFWQQNMSSWLAIATTSIGIMAFMALFGGAAGRVFNDLPAAVGFTGMASLLFWLGRSRLGFMLSCLTFVGRISYELYLIHMLTLVLFTRLFVDFIPWMDSIFFSLLFTLPVTIAIAWGLSKWFARVHRILIRRIAPVTVRSLESPEPVAIGQRDF